MTLIYEPQKTHTVYKNQAGKRLPGCTTVLGVLGMPNQLINWAWQCGADGLDHAKVRDEAAEAGTVAHLMIQGFLKEEDIDLSQASPQNQTMAKAAYTKFKRWWRGCGYHSPQCELKLVSGALEYGGTIDILARDQDNRVVLIDLKTSKGIYDKHWLQLGGYCTLCEANGIYPTCAYVCRVGRTEDVDDWETGVRQDTDKLIYQFLTVLQAYRALKGKPVLSLWNDLTASDYRERINQTLLGPFI